MLYNVIQRVTGETAMKSKINEKAYIIPTEMPAKRTAFGKTFAVAAGRYKSFHGVTRIHRPTGPAAWPTPTINWDESPKEF